MENETDIESGYVLPTDVVLDSQNKNCTGREGVKHTWDVQTPLLFTLLTLRCLVSPCQRL